MAREAKLIAKIRTKFFRFRTISGFLLNRRKAAIAVPISPVARNTKASITGNSSAKRIKAVPSGLPRPPWRTAAGSTAGRNGSGGRAETVAYIFPFQANVISATITSTRPTTAPPAEPKMRKSATAIGPRVPV
jgi:hypothetical protein